MITITQLSKSPHQESTSKTSLYSWISIEVSPLGSTTAIFRRLSGLLSSISVSSCFNEAAILITLCQLYVNYVKASGNYLFGTVSAAEYAADKKLITQQYPASSTRNPFISTITYEATPSPDFPPRRSSPCSVDKLDSELDILRSPPPRWRSTQAPPAPPAPFPPSHQG